MGFYVLLISPYILGDICIYSIKLLSYPFWVYWDRWMPTEVYAVHISHKIDLLLICPLFVVFANLQREKLLVNSNISIWKRTSRDFLRKGNVNSTDCFNNWGWINIKDICMYVYILKYFDTLFKCSFHICFRIYDLCHIVVHRDKPPPLHLYLFKNSFQKLSQNVAVTSLYECISTTMVFFRISSQKGFFMFTFKKRQKKHNKMIWNNKQRFAP